MRHTKGPFIPAKVDWANGTISGTVYGGEPELTKLMEKVSDAVIHTSLGIAHYFACFHFEKYDKILSDSDIYSTYNFSSSLYSTCPSWKMLN